MQICGKFNPQWREKDNVIDIVNENKSSYLCYHRVWNSYVQSGVGKYAMGSPSVEMYMDSYNQWGEWESGRGPQNYRWNNNGYQVGVNGTYPSSQQNNNSLSRGQNNIYHDGSSNFWLASPREYSSNIDYTTMYVSGSLACVYTCAQSISYGVCPVVSLGQSGAYLSFSEKTNITMSYDSNKVFTFENPFDMDISVVSSDTTIATVTKDSDTQITITSNSNDGLATITIMAVNPTNGATMNVDILVGIGLNDTLMSIEATKSKINSSNIQSYIGTEVDYNPEGGGVWRIFYYDAYGTYNKGSSTVFIKRDYDPNITYEITNSAKTGYSLADFKQFNKGITASSISNANDTNAAYICTKNATEWASYLDSDVAEYVIGGPPLEIFVNSYNQWKGTKVLDYKYVTSGTTLAYGSQGANTTCNANGYAIAPAYLSTSITDFGTISANNLVESGPTGKPVYRTLYTDEYWLGSPGCYTSSTVYAYSNGYLVATVNTFSMCPLVSLGH